MELGLSGKVVLITGSSKGLGLAMAEELGREGASLSICARDKQTLESAAEGLAGAGVEVLATPATPPWVVPGTPAMKTGAGD